MWLIIVFPQPLQIVSDGTVNVAPNGDALLPVVIAILLSALLKVLGYLEKHIRHSVERSRKLSESNVQKYSIAGILEQAQVVENIISLENHRGNIQRHQIAPALALLNIAYRTRGEFAADTTIFDSYWNRSLSVYKMNIYTFGLRWFEVGSMGSPPL